MVTAKAKTTEEDEDDCSDGEDDGDKIMVMIWVSYLLFPL
jgi:hypothetical protein